MENRVRETIENCFDLSKDGRIRFGDVVAKLTGAGVESYLADYRTGRTTYFLPCGESLDLVTQQPGTPIADEFDGDAVRLAIKGAQRDEIKYPDFVRLTRDAGCVGYIVWIRGRHVTYFGRGGETHVEHFPQ